MAKPVSVKVDTFGTGDERAAADFVMNNFDFRPRAIIDKLNLLRPIYRQSTNYGHFGRPGLPWETVEKAAGRSRALEHPQTGRGPWNLRPVVSAALESALCASPEYLRTSF
jgi:S-adenosylmethionine synthetase